MPWYWRAAIYIAAPLFGTYLYLTATRRSLGKRLSRDDLPSSEAVMDEDRLPDLTNAILHARDRKVIENLQAILRDTCPRNSLIGIVYGAGHMGAITAALMGTLKYRVIRAEWLSIFDYDPS